MNWKNWLNYSIYKKLWSIIGKRPWTWIYRDIWHKLEWFPQMQWAATGIGFEYLRQFLDFPWWSHFIWVGLYSYGYINGHFFWGKKYIPNQQPREGE